VYDSGGDYSASAMLERNHGCFNQEPHDIHLIFGKTDINAVVEWIKQK